MTQKTHTFSAETGKVLQLMIHSLYTNKDIFLRELISNASDACDKLRYEAVTHPELLEGESAFEIRVTIDEEGRRLTIADNGIGMNEVNLISNLGTIAKSGTQEFLNNLEGEKAAEVDLIGQFGVGFYSAFMVADKVEVFTRRAGDKQGYRWVSDGAGEYAIESAEDVARGTRIVLHMREDAKDYLDPHKLRYIVQTYSDHIGFPILLGRANEEPQKANSASALWTRPKNEVSEEQHQEFYRQVAHLPDKPWMVLHNKAEGKLEYTTLLYIPGMKPFDLFHPDRQRRVKLYVKRVFITEEGIELVPHYMRFLRGLVDSQDLPLNISRETLQHNPLLARMSEALVKRTLTELKKRADADMSDYAIFWKNFGAVLKEGLCEAIAPKEQILEACCFHSTAHQTDEADLTRLDTYIECMKEGQDTIYFLTADSLDAARANPQLEGFRKRGLEVLLLTDHVDDFWVNVVSEYKGKKLKSVTRVGNDLDAFTAEESEEKKEQIDALPEAQIQSLIAALKATYGEEVLDVRATTKLDESPVCLAVEEGAMDIRLEQFMRAQKQYPGRTSKILEINITHPIIRALAGKVQDEILPEDAAEAAWLLLDQARLVEGEEISNPGAFSRRISQFLAKGLAA